MKTLSHSVVPTAAKVTKINKKKALNEQADARYFTGSCKTLHAIFSLAYALPVKSEASVSLLSNRQSQAGSRSEVTVFFRSFKRVQVKFCYFFYFNFYVCFFLGVRVRASISIHQ